MSPFTGRSEESYRASSKTTFLSLCDKFLINIETPEKSTILTLNRMSVLKLHKYDQSYKSTISRLTNYATVLNGQCKSVNGLPADNWRELQLVLRMIETRTDSEAGTLAAVATLMLGEQQFVRQVEIKSAQWREACRQAASITGVVLN